LTAHEPVLHAGPVVAERYQDPGERFVAVTLAADSVVGTDAAPDPLGAE